MKSIFLMAILVSLVTIAFKGPDETPAEFFHRVKSLTAEAVEQGMENKKAAAKNDKALTGFGIAARKLIEPKNEAEPSMKVPERNDSAIENETISADPQFVLTDDKEVTNPRPAEVREKAIETLPPPSNADVPEMPAVTTENVLTEPLGDAGQIAEQIDKEPFVPIPGYRDIKGYYEDANRLLAEIK